MRLRTITVTTLVAAVTGAALVGCASDGDDAASADISAAPASPTTGSSSADGSTPGQLDVVAGEPFPADRCATNEAAGTVTFLTGFDFAATASIVDVIVAEANGYYDELCLDVTITPSFSTANYPLIAENDAQFASGGSFSEVVAFAAANDTDFVVPSVEGSTPIDSLIVKPGAAATLEDLAGTTIGVKGKLPSSITAMLGSVGLVEGEDYDTVLLDGFDPVAHIAIKSIVGFPGWKSNEPGTLERAGIEFDLFDPTEFDIPGSFGAIYTSRAFADANPTVVEDFMRATMRGLADAIDDPDAAVTAAMELVESGGNPNYLSDEGERFRWTTDAAMIASLTPEGTGLAVPDPDGLQLELDTYADFGLFGDGETPTATDYLSDALSRIYDDAGVVIWPG